MTDSKPQGYCELREGIGRRGTDKENSRWTTWGAAALAIVYTLAMVAIGAVVGTRQLVDQLETMDQRSSQDLQNQTTSFNVERAAWSNEKDLLRKFLIEKNLVIASKDAELKEKDRTIVDLVAKFAALGGKMSDLATSAAKASESSSETAKILAPKQD